MDNNMVSPDAASLAASAWLAEIEKTKWRLLSFRSRGQSDHSGPIFLRRFVCGAPCGGQLRAIVESFKHSAPIATVWVDGTEYKGPWRVASTIWNRDFFSKENYAKGDSTLTLVQDLILASAADEYGFPAQLSCSEIADVRYVWNASVIEGLPTSADPGYTYQIAGVRRDDTTGLFDYYVMRVFKKAQELLYETNETVFEHVTRLQRQAIQPEDFNPVLAGTPVPGTTIDVDARKNADCTIDETQTTTVAKMVESVFSFARDLFKIVASVKTVAVSDVLTEAPEPSGGVMVQNTSELRKDGKYNQEVQTTTERQVEEAQKSKTVDVKFVTDGQMDISAEARDLPTDLQIGETVSIEKTPGGIFRNTWRRIRIRLAGMRLALLFNEDAMKKTFEVTAVEAAEPLDPSFSGGGIVKTVRGSLNEAGAWDVTRQQANEKLVPKTRETVAVNTRAVITDLQAVVAAPASTPGDTEVGSSVTNTLTPGAFWETVRRTIRLLLGRISEGVTENRFKRQTEATEVQAASAGVSLTFVPGSITSINSQKNEAGGWDKRTTLDVAKLADGVKDVMTASSPYIDARLTRVVNDTAIPVIPSMTVAQQSVTQLQGVQENEFGRFEHAKLVLTAKPHIEIFEGTFHVVYTKTVKFRNYTKADAQALLASTKPASRVMFVSASSDFDLNDFGLVDGQLVLTGLDVSVGDLDWYSQGFTEIANEALSTDRTGKQWLTTTTESGIIQTGSNYQAGITAYVTGTNPRAGSSFSRMGAYGYSFRKVTDVNIVKEAYTE